VVRVVFQGRTDLPDGEVEAPLKIYERLRAPDLPGQLLSGDDLACPANQQNQDFGWLRLEL
jgi:hypothetical protein